MAYVKNIWVDQDVERPKTYEVTNNQDGSITLTDSFGLVTELGTPVNEVNMNHIEDGIDGCAIRKHNLTETFNLGEWVLGGTGNDEGIYKSLVANNVGNAITDDTKWEKVTTDLSGKMDTDGTNAVSSVKFADGQWVSSSYIIANSTSISYQETKTYDLSSYLPNDNYSYEVLFGLTGQSGSSSGNTICAYIGSDIMGEGSYVSIAYSATRTSGSAYGGGNAIIPIGASRIVKIWSSSSTNFTFTLYARIYRRIGTNQ